MTKGELLEKLAVLTNDTMVMVDDGDWGCHPISGVAIEQCSDGTLIAVIDIISRRKEPE